MLPALEGAVAGIRAGRVPEIVCPEGLRVLVQPHHLDQMLANLLGNAAKYAGRSQPPRGDRPRRRHGRARGRRRGSRRTARLRERLFQRFSRGDDTSRDVLGTGLGLLHHPRAGPAPTGGDVAHRRRVGRRSLRAHAAAWVRCWVMSIDLIGRRVTLIRDPRDVDLGQLVALMRSPFGHQRQKSGRISAVGDRIGTSRVARRARVGRHGPFWGTSTEPDHIADKRHYVSMNRRSSSRLPSSQSPGGMRPGKNASRTSHTERPRHTLVRRCMAGQA